MKVAALAPAAVLSWSSNWGPLKRGLQGAEEMIPSGGGGGNLGTVAQKKESCPGGGSSLRKGRAVGNYRARRDGGDRDVRFRREGRGGGGVRMMRSSGAASGHGSWVCSQSSPGAGRGGPSDSGLLCC